MNNTQNSQATANRRFAGACGWKKANERRYYLRRCRRCSNFMNWLVRPDGTARCQDCGAEHEARTEPSSNDKLRDGAPETPPAN